MQDHSFLSALSLITLALVIGWAAYQLIVVRQSQARRGERPGGIAGPSPE